MSAVSSVRCALGLPSGRRCRLMCRGTASLCPLHRPPSPLVFPTPVPSSAHFTLETVHKLLSSDGEAIVSALVELDKCYTVAHLDAILSMNLLDRLLQLLDVRFGPVIQFHAAWVLTNMTALEDNNGCYAVADAGGIEILVGAAHTLDDALRHQVYWCLANLAGADDILRAEVAAVHLRLPLMPALDLKCREEAAHLWMNVAPALSAELCVAQCHDNLRLLFEVTDHMNLKRLGLEILERIRHIHGHETLAASVEKCTDLLLEMCGTAVLAKKALLLVGDIVSSNRHDVIHRLLDNDLCGILKRLLSEGRFKVNVLWILSNVAIESAGTVLTHEDLIQAVGKRLIVAHKDECKEAVWFFGNLVKSATPTQVATILRLVPNLGLRLQALLIHGAGVLSAKELVVVLETFSALLTKSDAARRALLLTPYAFTVAEGHADAAVSAAATALLNAWVAASHT